MVEISSRVIGYFNCQLLFFFSFYLIRKLSGINNTEAYTIKINFYLFPFHPLKTNSSILGLKGIDETGGSVKI